jgi:AraC-like DNA-binding protein
MNTLTQQTISPTKKNNSLIEKLRESDVYQEYATAFSETTGLPVSIQAVDSWNLPHRDSKYENPFCAMMSQKNKTCAACLQVQHRLAKSAMTCTQTTTCTFGLSDTAIPLHQGNELIGFLHTGQIFRKAPTMSQFKQVQKDVADNGNSFPESELKENYFKTPVLTQKKHNSIVNLLQVFAKYLMNISNQIVIQQENVEPMMIKRAKEYIAQHQTDNISLGEVAKASNVSTFYFCKMFKKITGLNFTEFLSRSRIEKAKNLLLNPNLRISEIAYEVGFQSLTHFNRVFKKLIGESPTEYRHRLAKV